MAHTGDHLTQLAKHQIVKYNPSRSMTFWSVRTVIWNTHSYISLRVFLRTVATLVSSTSDTRKLQYLPLQKRKWLANKQSKFLFVHYNWSGSALAEATSNLPQQMELPPVYKGQGFLTFSGKATRIPLKS